MISSGAFKLSNKTLLISLLGRDGARTHTRTLPRVSSSRDQSGLCESLRAVFLCGEALFVRLGRVTHAQTRQARQKMVISAKQV